ncbi:MAG: MFS transporter [Actinobacteria bacterium]|nr:MAG: MFS transporter [Actinomycetota bacterium]
MTVSQTQPRTSSVVIAILSAAMFIYVIDTTLMNVSISALVEDLDTNVGAVQGAITLYTLTMAAFMLTGGKLGDIWGSKRAFRIGLVIYGTGTTITAFAPTLLWVIIGWSILEGLGSALIVPAINTLVRANYEGTRRATAYGTLFGVAAAGAAFGPLVGGWVTTAYSWRLAFGMEAIIVVIVLASSGLLRDAAPVVPKPKLDYVGVVLSALGLGLVVFGVLQTTDRGWTDPLVLAMLLGGLGLLGAFVWWIKRQESLGRPVLVHASIFRHRSISAGLPVLATQTFAQAGLLFLVPLFTQSVLGFDAFETGLTLLPLSIGVLVTSMTTPRLGRIFYPKYIIQGGLVLLFVGGYVLASALPGASEGSDLAVGLLIGGLAIGIIAGQLPNMILSGVEPEEASEASGLQGTSLNLGMALGTAVIGTVILSVGFSSISSDVDDSATIPNEFKGEISLALDKQLTEPAKDQLADELASQDPAVQEEAQQIFADGTVRGFQGAILAGGLVALFGALGAFFLPRKKLEPDDDDDGDSSDRLVAETVRNTTLPGMQLEMDDLSTG